MYTVFSILTPQGLIFSDPFEGGGGGGGGGVIRKGGLFERGGFFQHKAMCVKHLCILAILTQL